MQRNARTPKMPCASGGPIAGRCDERTQTCGGPRQCGTSVRSPHPLIPSPSGEGTGAVSLPGVASGPAGQCLSCDDRRTELRQTKNQVLEEVREDERMK